VRRLVVLCALVLGCHGGPAPARPRPPAVDAPYELADDLDFAERADALAALPPGDARTALRVELATVLGARLDRALASGRLERASAVFGALADLWHGEPAALAELAELPGWADRLVRARAGFARGGADKDAALVLALRLAVAPTEADRAELTQITEFADQLAMARMGPLGEGTGAIAVLAPIVERGLAPELLPRYVALVVDRANRADMAISAGLATAATSPALRAAMGASRDLAIALAAGHQVDRLSAALTELHGSAATAAGRRRARDHHAGGDRRGAWATGRRRCARPRAATSGSSCGPRWRWRSTASSGFRTTRRWRRRPR
jgi:hypothetical protein